MKEGTDDLQKRKRYLHRHLALPPGGEWSNFEGKDLLIEFAYHYVQSLLNYCTDDRKPGICLLHALISHNVPNTHYCFHTHTRLFHHVRANYIRVQETPRR